MVRQWQTLFYDHRYSHTILNDAVDFVKLAEAMGAKAIRITKMEEVEPALKEALACPGPIVLDCMTIRISAYSRWYRQAQALMIFLTRRI